MKRIALSFLFIFALSCGTAQTPSLRHRLTVQFRDSIIGDYYLIAVRTNSVVLAPYAPPPLTSHQVFGLAKDVPFEKIEKIYEKSDGTLGNLFLGGLVGFGFGCIATGGIGCGYRFDCLDLYNQNKSSKYQPYYLGGGFLVGVIASYFANYTDKEFSLTKSDDIKILKMMYSFYPDLEPVDLLQEKK